MTPATKLRRQMDLLLVVLVFMAGGAIGFLVNQWANGLTDSDLVPGRVQACNTAIKTSIIAANLIAADTYTPKELESLTTLSGSCLDDQVYDQLDPVLLDLLRRSPVQ